MTSAPILIHDCLVMQEITQDQSQADYTCIVGKRMSMIFSITKYSLFQRAQPPVTLRGGYVVKDTRV